MTAKLFPVFHATDSVGLREILWLQGQITDEDKAILNRFEYIVINLQKMTELLKIFQ